MPHSIDQTTLENLLIWRRLEDLTADEELACIDGRFEDAVLGAPGGDAGEFVVVLSALEERREEPFSDDEIARLLEHHIEQLGRFYLHSDRMALDQLDETLRRDAAMAEALEEAGSAEALLRHPPQAIRARLAELVVEPDHVGCGHLKLMLQHAEEYGLRRTLVEAVIAAFFELLWQSRPEADFTVLEGVHTEEAVVVFETDEPLTPSTEVPAVRHSEDVPSLFVNHLPASRFKRARCVEALADVSSDVPADDERSALLERAEELAAHYADVTMSHLAPDLPVMIATFSGREISLEA